MRLARPLSASGLVAGLALLMAAMAWMVFTFAGDRAGMRNFSAAEPSTVEVLATPAAGLALAEVIALPADVWSRWNGRDYLTGAHGQPVWLRVTLRNASGSPLQGVFADTEYFPDRVELWSRDARGEWRSMRSGEAVTARDKPLWARTAAFPMTVPALGERVLYVRGEDFYFVYLRPRWWPRAEDFFATQIQTTLAETLCYGALVALWLYNVVLWVRLRFPDTGSYVLYAGAATIFNFVSNGGVALLGFSMRSPWKEMAICGSLGLSGIFLIQFGRVFLDTQKNLPRSDRGLRILRWVLVGLVAGVLAMPRMTGLGWLAAIVVGVTVSHGTMLAVAVWAWRRGVKHARFFIAAFGVLFVGAMPAVVTWLNQDILAWAAMCLLGASALEMLLLSFAVADRFAQTQRQLMEETEQRRMMEKAYSEELETEVTERTRELLRANADKDRILAIIGHDLRAPLTGLMRSADEETGNFARETEQTGRALLLLIEDLGLWTRLRAGARAVAHHPVTGLIGPALALHRTLAESSGIDVRVEVPAELNVETDLVLAQTLVRNLLANALKFARTVVVLRAEAGPEGRVRFSVSNDGPPLPPEVAARFASGENEPMTATGGLGLRLCREICHALGAQLAAGSGRESGTEFCFTLKTTTVPGSRPA